MASEREVRLLLELAESENRDGVWLNRPEVSALLKSLAPTTPPEGRKEYRVTRPNAGEWGVFDTLEEAQYEAGPQARRNGWEIQSRWLHEGPWVTLPEEGEQP